jgi:hypothetical protein
VEDPDRLYRSGVWKSMLLREEAFSDVTGERVPFFS